MIDHSKRFANGRVYIKGIEEFWEYIKKLSKFHRRENFEYYLKELEFRYNSREMLDIAIFKFWSGKNLIN
jgi:transposase